MIDWYLVFCLSPLLVAAVVGVSALRHHRKVQREIEAEEKERRKQALAKFGITE